MIIIIHMKNEIIDSIYEDFIDYITTKRIFYINPWNILIILLSYILLPVFLSLYNFLKSFVRLLFWS